MNPPAASLIRSTVPVLASLDIAESAAFYAERLGFGEQLRTGDYLIVARDGCEIHFWLCPDRAVAEQTSCYVRGDTRELYVIDPHGNLLKFGEPL